VPTPNKHPRLKTAVRKTVKWGGAGLSVLLLAVWIGSGWYGTYRRVSSGRMYMVSDGVFEIRTPIAGPFPRKDEWAFYEHDNSLSKWWFRWTTVWLFEHLEIPLWLPALLSLLATAAAWRADAKYMRRVRVGLCAGCGYDRAGLAADAVCPECGKQPEAR